MTTLLARAGVGKLLSFYRYFAINAPRVTTASGIVLLAGVAAIRLHRLVDGVGRPAYLDAYFVLVVLGALAASAGMVAVRAPVLVRVGWGLGSLVSAASLGMYVAGRTAGLPGVPQLVGRWNEPVGTAGMVFAVLFLVLHFSVLTGMNIAVPQRRRWHS
ncbi:hypothetical protein FHX42_002288 [Saccharopolyspora lacisalsi]|uniref:Uncharacterized protein n=1 Tax=Halosaccharopolyspora lacisalsi TaxID=1000566 RepID=A0A839E0F5_9PSEU|nr:hypothetical protein [Halosaccharopolyspora lacisalsi]MBA8824941.1 hypothetical protein [Halosaccharopolyspora lacisalsi]